MTALAQFFEAFQRSIDHDDHAALAPHLRDAKHAARARVYRNTVLRGAADALANAYPAVRRLVGDAFFDALAIAYFAAARPRERSMSLFGVGFAEFLATSPGVTEVPYLPDVARLDRAWLEAHTEADAPALNVEDLAAYAPDELIKLGMSLHPSVRIVPLSWSVYDAWAANRMGDGAERTARTLARADARVLVWRRRNEVQSAPIGAGEAVFLAAIAKGAPLAAAAERALAGDSDFDVSAAFANAVAAEILIERGDND